MAGTRARGDGEGGAFGEHAGLFVDGEDAEEVCTEIWDHDEAAGGVEDHFVLVRYVLAGGVGTRCGELVSEYLHCLEAA